MAIFADIQPTSAGCPAQAWADPLPRRSGQSPRRRPGRSLELLKLRLRLGDQDAGVLIAVAFAPPRPGLHLSPDAATIYAKAEELRRYLHDFGCMPAKPTDSVVLWRRYLVFAEVFGMADEVDKELRLARPSLAAAVAFPLGSLRFWLATEADADNAAHLPDRSLV